MAYFQLLGTGPSTPITEGTGRNRRRRSCGLMQHISTYIMIDVTHDFDTQIETALSVTHVVVSNGSRDAAGGLGNLDRWTDRRISLYAPKRLWKELLERYGPFENIDHVATKIHDPIEVGDLELTTFPVETTPGKDGRDNYGYFFDTGKKRVTYASDMKLIPEESTKYFQDNHLLVVDGAGWDKDLPTHRGVLNHLSDYVSGNNDHILFTDMGRSAPPHTQASTIVRRICHRADVGYDNMKIPLGR